MGNSKKPWEDIPIEIIIDEEKKRKREEEERQRPRIELPIEHPTTASHNKSPEHEVVNSTIITFKL